MFLEAKGETGTTYNIYGSIGTVGTVGGDGNTSHIGKMKKKYFPKTSEVIFIINFLQS